MNAPLILNPAVVPMPRKKRQTKPTPPPVEVAAFPYKVKVNYPKVFTVEVIRPPKKIASAINKAVKVVKTGLEAVKTVAAVDEKTGKRFGQIDNDYVTLQIVPHAGVTNNNKRLWKSIYQMFSLYQPFNTRREKWRSLTYREKDFVWYDIVMGQDGGQKKIEFYISTSKFMAERLKHKLENEIGATFQFVPLYAPAHALTVPEKDTIIQELRYMHHDIFSLNTNTHDNDAPIASILNTVDELQYDGDFVRLSFCMDAVNRKTWVNNALWAVDKIKKGKVPQRATVDGKKATNTAKVVFGGIINEVHGLIEDTFEAFTNVFFKSDKRIEKRKMIDKPISLADEIGSTRAGRDTYEKVNLPVFKTRIRIAAHSVDQLSRETLAETPALAFQEVTESNELQPYRVRGKRAKEIIGELNTFRLSKRTLLDNNVNQMSTDELAKIALQLPPKKLQMRYDDALNVKTRVETDLPAAVRDPKGIYLGVSENKDKEEPAHIPTDDKDNLYSGYTFIGKQGSGKDNAIQNFVYEANMKHDISFVIPDWICQPGKKGMADGIRDLLPPERVIDLDLSDPNFIIPLDITAIVEKLGRDGASAFSEELIDFLNMSELTRAKKFLRGAAKASGGSLIKVKRILEDATFRAETANRLIDGGNIRLAEELIGWGGQEDIGGKIDPILDRLEDFFGNDRLYSIFSQEPNPEIDFEKWMREGKVIIVRMPVRKLLGAAKILVHWLTLKVFMTRMLMSEQDKERHGCFMIFNEPEQVESRGLAEFMGRIATEGRKERLGSIFAFHHWDKLPDYLQKNLQGGGVNQFLFASNYKKNFEAAKERLEPYISIETAMQTPKHYAICVLNTKEPLPPFIVHMEPPRPDEDRHNNSFLTKRHARMYGRKWEELQKAL